MNVAAIDIGTNSVRLLITDGQGQQLAREMHITRLGQGVDKSGALADEAIERTVRVLAEYGAIIGSLGVQRIRATATSAARDAKNREVFFSQAQAALGVLPECIPGEEEAQLSFRGATAGIDPTQGPFLVVDIGGGSTELVVGGSQPEALISVDLGCVRMTERHLHSDPPSQAQLKACFADVRRELARARAALPLSKVRSMIGLAGTITALGYLQKGLKRYAPEETHRMTLSRQQVEQLFTRLSQASVQERRAMLAEPKRAEVIVGGAAVLVTLLHELDIAELIVSESDILDGIAAALRD